MRRALALAALALAGCGGDPPIGGGSTVRATVADRDGNGFLDAAGGEPLRARTELAPAAPPGAVLATWGQITDPHVRDEESPSRVPFLDRFGEPFETTFRPHEALSAQVLDAAVRAVAAERPQALLVTGDVADNAQRNELDLALRVLGGGRAAPDSGAPGYRGVQEDGEADPFYYRPGVDPPRHPDLLAAAQRPFAARGIRVPWFGVPGNHDLLLQGELPPTPRTDAIATGRRLVTALDPRVRLPETADTERAVDVLLGASGRDVRVPPDPQRRSVTSEEMVRALARGRPTRVPGRGDYVADVGGARMVVLDLTDRTGGQEAVTDGAQLAWLREQVAGAGRPVVLVSHQPPPEPVLGVLDGAPDVVAAIHGDRHRNRITPRESYWIVGTASLADFPMQARMFRLRRAGSGMVLETWMVDLPGRGLPGVARELAFLDAQGGRPRGLAGSRADRNARLYVP